MGKTNRNSRIHVTLAIACLAIGSARCHPSGDPLPGTNISTNTTTTTTTRPAAATNPAATSPAPVPATLTFNDAKDGVRFQYTKAWVSKPDPDYVLQLVPSDGTGGRRIVFDVPDLPFHLPGMITLGLIEHGYISDLKDKYKNVHVDSSADHPMPSGAKARLVESSWTQDGMPHKDVALLILRKDHVYILGCGCDLAHLAATRGDFDMLAKSFEWTK